MRSEFPVFQQVCCLLICYAFPTSLCPVFCVPCHYVVKYRCQTPLYCSLSNAEPAQQPSLGITPVHQYLNWRGKTKTRQSNLRNLTNA